MRKLLLLTTISLIFVQCNKTKQLPNLASDNDYEKFELKDRVCQINQHVTELDKTRFQIEDKNAVYNFSNEGYLISDSIFNNLNVLIETNTYQKFDYPLVKKQFISTNDFILNQIQYDSLKNILNIKKTTSKNQIIEEQKNTYSNNYIIREDYFLSGDSTPNKIIKIDMSDDLVKNKVYFNKQNQINDSVVFHYNNKKQIVKEIHFDANKQPLSTLIYTYDGNNITSTTYLDAKNKEEAIEKFRYNKSNKLIEKSSFTVQDNLNHEELNEYDTSNKLTKSNTKVNGELVITSTFVYNDKNNLIKFESSNLQSKEKLVKTITYSYDDKGNWITKEVLFNNIPTYKIERKIKYCK